MTFRLRKDGTLPDQIRCSPLPSSSSAKDVDRYVGSLLGLSIGDALGASVEFRPRTYLVSHPVREMQGGGTWGLEPGQWTDDTSMALCLASSLLEKNRFDPYDQLVKYKWWFEEGYLSSTGRCFDIGNATQHSLQCFIQQQRILQRKLPPHVNVDELEWKDLKREKQFQVNCSSTGVAGNGALMRLAPVPLFFSRHESLAVEYSGQSARLTHGDDKAVDSCRFYAALIVAALQGQSKDQILHPQFLEINQQWFGKKPLHSEILRVAQGSYKNPKGYEGGIRGKGYIVAALEAALWAFWSTKDFRSGALAAVNLGDDTDTTAAIFGQLAGAFYGYDKLPRDWVDQVYASNLLISLGQWIHFRAKEYQLNEDDREELQRTQNISLSPVHTSPQPLSTFNEAQQLTPRRIAAAPEVPPRTRVPLTPTSSLAPFYSPAVHSSGQRRIPPANPPVDIYGRLPASADRFIPVEMPRDYSSNSWSSAGQGTQERGTHFGTTISPSAYGHVYSYPRDVPRRR